MAPKPKKDRNPKRVLVSLDDIDTTILTRDKLEEYCVNIYEEIKKERQNSEFLRLDRDKLANMVAIAREQLKNGRDSNRIKQHKIQDAEDNHRITMWENRQKLIHLSNEKSIECLDNKLESIKKICHEQINHEERMNLILSDINEISKEIKLLETDICKAKQKQEIAHAENKSKLRQKDKELHMLMESKREKTLGGKIKELETKHDQKEKNLEKMKNKATAQLLKNNMKFSSDLKHYYNQIVNHNLSVINMMKTEFQQLKVKTAAIEKQCFQLKQENNFLASSLNESVTEEEDLQRKLASAGKDKNQLKFIKNQLETNKHKLEKKAIEYEVLKMRLNEEDNWFKSSTEKANVSMIHRRTTAEQIILLLELIVSHLFHRNNEADSILHNIKHIFRQQGKKSDILQSIPDYQNTLMDEMNFEIAAVAEKRHRIIKAYKEMLYKHHLHMSDTGFTPLTENDIFRTAVSLKVLIDIDD